MVLTTGATIFILVLGGVVMKIFVNFPGGNPTIPSQTINTITAKIIGGADEVQSYSSADFDPVFKKNIDRILTKR
jgi:hypothetical protein